MGFDLVGVVLSGDVGWSLWVGAREKGMKRIQLDQYPPRRGLERTSKTADVFAELNEGYASTEKTFFKFYYTMRWLKEASCSLYFEIFWFYTNLVIIIAVVY